MSLVLLIHAKSFYVNRNNNIKNCFNSVSLAISYAEDGDTIILAAGWYDNDFISIDKSIVFIGNQSNAGYRSGKSRTNGESMITFSSEPASFLLINAPGVVLDGLMFGTTEQELIAGIYVNSSHVVIKNCRFSKVTQVPVFLSSTANDVVVKNNFIDDCVAECILNQSENAEFSNNFLKNLNSEAVIISSTHAIIRNNDIFSSSDSVFVIYGTNAYLSFVHGNVKINTSGKSDVNEIFFENKNIKEGLKPLEPAEPTKVQSFFANLYLSDYYTVNLFIDSHSTCSFSVLKYPNKIESQNNFNISKLHLSHDDMCHTFQIVSENQFCIFKTTF